ncbi:MAG: hypothetical protein ABI664_16160 [bacterium]
MAAGPKLDGAGIQKMKTIEEAMIALQRLHGMVEQYALALKQNKPTSMYGQQVKRTLSPLVGLLKGQFGMIADVAASLNLVATRGGAETVKVRMLREGVGSLRQQLEIAVVKVKELHAVKEEVVPGARKPGE